MVSSPIGGFMPIPLAMMPAFMAYQSILMGDSFGQAYQYGKRKISAMSNEEFNKLSVSQMFENATTEYDRMIPTLKASMKNSQELQGFIVKELLAIIPNLITDAFGGIEETPKDTTQSQSPFLKNQSFAQAMGTIADPIFIRYTTDREPVFNEPAIENFKKSTEGAFDQAGTKQDLIDKLKKESEVTPSLNTFNIDPKVESKVQDTTIGRKLRLQTNLLNKKKEDVNYQVNKINEIRSAGTNRKSGLSIQENINIKWRTTVMAKASSELNAIANIIRQLQVAHNRTYKKYWTP